MDSKQQKIILVSTVIVIAGLFIFGYMSNKNKSENKDDIKATITGIDTSTSTNDMLKGKMETNDQVNKVTMEPSKTITTKEGLQITDSVIGTGNAIKTGDTVLVHYTGTLTNGTKFDSSYDRNQPIQVTVGLGQVIAGWELGLQGMKLGGKRHLVIPSALGYGNQAVGGVIPANSTLVFDMEVVAIKN